jgi:hypothetical protein
LINLAKLDPFWAWFGQKSRHFGQTCHFLWNSRPSVRKQTSGMYLIINILSLERILVHNLSVTDLHFQFLFPLKLTKPARELPKYYIRRLHIYLLDNIEYSKWPLTVNTKIEKFNSSFWPKVLNRFGVLWPNRKLFTALLVVFYSFILKSCINILLNFIFWNSTNGSFV